MLGNSTILAEVASLLLISRETPPPAAGDGTHIVIRELYSVECP